MHLPDEQATADVETDVQRGGVRLGHVDAVERHVGALVDDLGHAGLVEEGEVGAGEEDHDEGVEGDLAQHEGPVLGENLGQAAREELVAAQALVNKCGAGGADLLHGVGRGVGGTHPRSQKLGRVFDFLNSIFYLIRSYWSFFQSFVKTSP